MDTILFYIIGFIIAFIIGVYITRWIFGIEKIIDALERQNNSLEQQNNYSLVQVRLLKKILMNEGVSSEEIDEIIAIIWITGENSGCYALVDIVTDPAILGKSEDYEHWVPKDGTGRKHQNEDPIVHKVKIRLIHNLFDKPILKNMIPMSEGMLEKVKKGIRGTNFASDKKDYDMILSLIGNN